MRGREGLPKKRRGGLLDITVSDTWRFTSDAMGAVNEFSANVFVSRA